MLAIYRRELKSYLHSFMGSLFIAITLFFNGLYFVLYNVIMGYPYFSYVVSSSVFILLILVPFLTMRSISEERRNKTDQLILTAPISVGKVVVGKYLALLTVFTIPTAVLCVFPLVMTTMGVVPLAEAYVAILGYYLFGMLCLAVGLFVSSLTETPIISAILSFLLLFVGYTMTDISAMVPNEFVQKMLDGLDTYLPLVRLLNGTLDLLSVVYYISATALLLFLTAQSIQKRRYNVSVKTLSVGAYSGGMIVVAIVATVVFNVLVAEMPVHWTAFDISYQQLYTIGDQTKEFIDNMEDDVNIYVMVAEESRDETVAQMLERYDDLSDHITVEYVDPSKNPNFHTKYTNSSVTTNSLIVVSEKRSKVVRAADLYEIYYDYTTGEQTTTGFDGEGQITSALAYVTSDEIPKAFIIEGHGEVSLGSDFKDTLAKENIETEDITLMNVGAVPENAACIIINAPKKDLSSADLEMITAYLDNGGKAIVNIGIVENELPNFDKLLAYMGMEIAEGMVIEGNADYYYQDASYLLPEISYSDYTSGVYNNYLVFTPWARGIIVDEEAHTDIAYDQFLTTSGTAYSKVDYLTATDYARTDADIAGPFAIGVEAIKTLSDGGKATMILYSCGEMFTDEANEVVSGANQMVFGNTLSKLSDHEVSVSIPGKSYTLSYLTSTQSHIFMITAIAVVFLPVATLILGFVIWFVRRKR